MQDFFAQMGASEWIALIATAATIIGGFGTFWYRSLARRREQALAETRDQIARVDAAAVSWGFRCIETMSEIHAVLRASENLEQAPVRDDVVRLLATVSALTDQGRLFFPNVNRDIVGLDRPAAMRGYRPAILDALLVPYFELELARGQSAEDYQRDAERRLSNVFNARRAFISELQEALDPTRDGMLAISIVRRRQLANIDDEPDWDSVKKLVDDFEARYGTGRFWPERPRTRRQIVEDSTRRK